MKRKYPDGPRIPFPLVIVGQILRGLFPYDPLAFGLKVAQQFGDIAHYQLGPLHVYQLSHSDLARQILFEQPEKFHKSKLIKRAFRPFAGEGLTTSDGTLWRQQRKLMQPAFHHRHLTVYSDVMVADAVRLVESFVDGEVREITAEMSKVTLSVVARSLFGADLPREASEMSRSTLAILDAVNQRLTSILHMPSWAPTRRNLRERRELAELDATLHRFIQARRRSGESSDDLLSMLLAAVDEDSGARMSDQQLRDEMATMFLSGHHTTGMALTWIWYLLARHPEVEAKLSEELRRVLAGRVPGMADLPKLHYADMVIREALRLYPPVPAFAREPIEDVTIGGYSVPKGSLVTVNTYALHRDSRIFTNPDKFDPDRFAPGWEERIPRYAYIPFGGGQRTCIGNSFAMMEVRLILATVAQSYKLSLEPDKEIVPMQLFTLRPSGPVRMRLQRREAAPVS